MSFTICNIRPSILHIPDSGLRLDSGETAIVKMLSPQMEVLVANQALVLLVASDPDSPAVIVPVAEISTVTEPEINIDSLPEIPVVEETVDYNAVETETVTPIEETPVLPEMVVDSLPEIPVAEETVDDNAVETETITPDEEATILPEMVPEPEPAAIVTGQQTKKSAAEKYKNAQ